MANLAAVRNATFTFGFGQALSANQTHLEIYSTPFFTDLLMRDSALQRAIAASNATAGRLSLWDVMDFTMAATAEGTDAAASNFSPTNIDHTPARQNLRWDIGDDEAARMPGGVMGAVAQVVNMNLMGSPSESEIQAMGLLGAAAYGAFVNRTMALVKALAGGFSNVTGVALNPLTRALFEAAVDAVYTRGGRGEMLWLDNATAWGTVSADYAALLGAGQFSKGAQIAIDRGGAEVTDVIYRNTRHATVTGLPTDGAGSTYGCVISSSAISLQTGTPELAKNAELVGVIGDPGLPVVTIERRRSAGGSNIVTATCWTAIREREDAGGQTLIHTT